MVPHLVAWALSSLKYAASVLVIATSSALTDIRIYKAFHTASVPRVKANANILGGAPRFHQIGRMTFGRLLWTLLFAAAAVREKRLRRI